MKKIKLLNVNKYYTPEMGGVETVCKQYSNYLKDDFDITVLCVSKKFSLFTKKEVIDGVNVVRCSSMGSFFSMPISFTFIIYYLILKLNNDIIVSHLPFPLFDIADMLTFFIKRKKYLIWHSDIVKQKKIKKIIYPIIKYSLKSCDGIIVTSPNMIEFSEDLNKFSYKCHVIPLAIDNYVENSIVKCKSNKEIDFLFFGRLVYYKGVNVLLDSLLKAKEANRQWNIIIAGEGEFSNQIKEVIAENDMKNIIFIDRYLTTKEKYDYLDRAKCFLFPSIENSEAFGITQLEAMNCGTPVINTNLNSGVPWVSLHNETGLTIEPNNSQQLYEAMVKIIDMDDESYSNYQKQALIRVGTLFSHDVVVGKLKKILI